MLMLQFAPNILCKTPQFLVLAYALTIPKPRIFFYKELKIITQLDISYLQELLNNELEYSVLVNQESLFVFKSSISYDFKMKLTHFFFSCLLDSQRMLQKGWSSTPLCWRDKMDEEMLIYTKWAYFINVLLCLDNCQFVNVVLQKLVPFEDMNVLLRLYIPAFSIGSPHFKKNREDSKNIRHQFNLQF